MNRLSMINALNTIINPTIAMTGPFASDSEPDPGCSTSLVVTCPKSMDPVCSRSGGIAYMQSAGVDGKCEY